MAPAEADVTVVIDAVSDSLALESKLLRPLSYIGLGLLA